MKRQLPLRLIPSDIEQSRPRYGELEASGVIVRRVVWEYDLIARHSV